MIADARHAFPLGEPLQRPGDGGADTHTDSTMVVPFGLRLAGEPQQARVDMSQVAYDEQRQIAVVGEGGDLVPALKHTSTVTKTFTSDRDKPETDTDATGR